MRRVLIAAAIVFVYPATAMAATPAGLTVEHQAQPLAVEAAAPLLGWHGAGDRVPGQGRHEPGHARRRLGLRQGAVERVGQRRRTAARRCRTRPASTGRCARSQGDRASAYAPPASFGTAVKSGWTATPIWSSAPVLGTDYDVDVDFTVTTVAAGIKFRVNGANSFMWQIRGDSSNELRPHVQVNGTYSQLKAVRLPMTIGLNTKHHARINVVGSTIRTYIDDVLVDTTVDARNPNGSIGFRHGSTESARFDNVKVTLRPRRCTSNDFSAPNTDFTCGTVTNGELVVGTARDCVVRRHRQLGVPAQGLPGRRQADRVGHGLRLRALHRARPPVRLQAHPQRQGRRRRPDARDQQRDADDVQRLRRHGTAQGRRQRARRARLHDRRQAASSPSS